MNHEKVELPSTLLSSLTASPLNPGTGVLLIPGFGSNAAVWEEVRSELAANVSVGITVGAATAQAVARGATKIETFADELWKVVDSLGWSRVVLVGHSVGALTACEMAAQDRSARCKALVLPNGGIVNVSKMMASPLRVGLRHPLKLAAFAIIAAAGILPISLRVCAAIARSDRWSKLLLRWFAGPRLYANYAQRRIVLESVPDRGLARGLLANRHYWARLEQVASEIRVPVAILAGSRDPIASPAESSSLRDYFHHATMKVCDNVGHCIPLEAPETVAAAVRSLLA